MSVNDEKLHEIIALIYESAAEPDLWPDLLDRLSDHVSLELALTDSSDSRVSEGATAREVLTKHFKRASRLNRKISRLHENLDASISVLNRLPLGLLFVESGGSVVFANQRAQLVFDGDYNLNVVDGRLLTSSRRINQNICRHIDEVLKEPASPSKTIHVSSALSGPFSLSISSLESMNISQPGMGRRYALILIATPNVPFHVTQQVLQDRYGLTPAEAGLSLALVDAGNLDGAAKKLSISKHTARTHLKSVFQKTGVSKQPELIKLVLSSPEALVADSVRSAIEPVIHDQKWCDMPRRSRYIRLYDGRKLGFAEYGNPDGVPVIVNHGVAASRLQTHPDENIAVQAGVRLIVPDRPGIGLSDFKENRQVMEWSDDVRQLADQLGIERFAMIGLTTGGGHWTLQCAFKIPHRLSAVSLVSTRISLAMLQAAPSIRSLLGMARVTPSLFYQYLKIMGVSVKKHPEIYLKRRLPDHAEVDQTFLRSPVGEKLFIEPLVEALRQGPKGIAWDIVISMKEWGFDLGQISYPVKIWHGMDDLIVPFEEAESAARLLPNCKTVFVENEGQYLFVNHWKEILDDVVREHCRAS